MRRTEPVDIGLLLVLAALWGSAFMFIKIGVSGFPPLTLVLVRMGVTALALASFSLAMGHGLPRGIHVRRALVVVGAISSAIPFTMVAWSEKRIDSGAAAIIIGMTPVTTVVIAHFLRHDERLSPSKILGAAVAFSGLVVLVGPRALAGLELEVASFLTAALATLFYAATTVYVRFLGHISAIHIATGSAISATVMVLPFSLIIDAPWTLDPSGEAWFGALALALLPTAAGTALYYHLVARTSATFGSSVNYLIPLAGVLWGMAFLGERPGWEALAALALILAGVTLISLGGRVRRARPT